jgi:protein-disulfide isomerase
MASNQKPFYIALGVVIVGGGAFIASRMKGSQDVAIPANVVVTAADTSGFRGYVTGSASAPVEVTEYGDLECPICASFETVQFPDIKMRLIDAGKIRFRYRDFPLDGPHKHPRVSAHAAACADEQGKYWEAQQAMFGRQVDYALSDSPMSPLSDIMKSVGVNVDTWNTCMASKKFAGRIQASENEGTALGVNSTPSFLIAGKIYVNPSADRIVRIVDSAIADGPKSAPLNTAPKSTGGQ